MTKAAFKILQSKVESCRICPRLTKYRETVAPKKEYANETYWRRPLFGFGDHNASLFILGLAPSAHGGNRTGRIFTGDGTSQFLYKALHEAGFANKPASISKNDGVKLISCYLTAAVKCAPPKNLPTLLEIKNCAPYWHEELLMLQNVKCVLALGKIAFDDYLRYAKSKNENTSNMRFSHGARYSFVKLPTLYASYHPTPQNTNTKKLTEKMFLQLFKEIKSQIKS